MTERLEPLWLSRADALQYHEVVLLADGGSPGISNETNLEAALLAPKNCWYYKKVDCPFELAASYLVHWAKGHCFVDGNKRTAMMMAISFLGYQGIDVEVTDDDVYAMAELAASVNSDTQSESWQQAEAAITEWLRRSKLGA